MFASPLGRLAKMKIVMMLKEWKTFVPVKLINWKTWETFDLRYLRFTADDVKRDVEATEQVRVRRRQQAAARKEYEKAEREPAAAREKEKTAPEKRPRVISLAEYNRRKAEAGKVPRPAGPVIAGGGVGGGDEDDFSDFEAKMEDMRKRMARATIRKQKQKSKRKVSRQAKAKARVQGNVGGHA